MNSWSSLQNINDWRLWIGKTNVLLNLISHQPGTDKHSYNEDLHGEKYQLLIHKYEGIDLNQCNDQKLLPNTQIIWAIFIKILMNKNKTKTTKNLIRWYGIRYGTVRYTVWYGILVWLAIKSLHPQYQNYLLEVEN